MLKLRIAKLEDVDEAIRSLYIPDGDGFKLDADVPAPEDTTGLKTALAAERKRAKTAEDKIAEADAARLAAEQLAEASKVGITDAKLKEIRAQIQGELDSKYKPHIEERDRLKGENRSLKLDNQVKSQIVGEEIGVRGDRVEQFWSLYKDSFDLTEDGQPVVKANPGQSIKDFCTSVAKKAIPEFFAGTKATGGGGGGGGGGDIKKGTVTTTADDILRDPSAALAAARAAGKTE